MPSKTYTILILARGSSRFRKVRVSTRTTVIAGVVATFVIGLAVMAPRMAWTRWSQSAVVDELLRTNDALKAEKLDWEGTLAHLSERLDRSEQHANRLASELGLDMAAAPAAGGASGGLLERSILEQEVDSLGRRAETVDSSLAELDRAYRKRLSMFSATPNTMPIDGWFSHGFGWRKDPWTGERRFHRGIDIVADTGTPIRAPGDGVVSRTARVSDYGNTIDISHGSGYVTRYAHLSEVLVKTGQRVERGDVIGRVGSTGRSTGAHLHYEVFRDGRRVNPWKYLGQH